MATFLLLLAWLACTKSSLRIPVSVCGPFAHAAPAAVTFRRCRQECSKCHQPAQYPCVGRDCGPNAMFQRGLQRSGLASHELHHTLDDTIGLAFSNWWSLRNGLASFLASLCDFPRCCLNRWLVVAPERDSVVPELADELRCSLCDPGELRSFSWNQHCPRHLVPPFTDDQHKRHLFFRFPSSIDTRSTPSTSS